MDASVSNWRGLRQDIVYVLASLYQDWFNRSLNHAADTFHGARSPCGSVACCIRTELLVVIGLVELRILR